MAKEKQDDKLTVRLSRDSILSFLDGCDLKSWLKGVTDEVLIKIFETYLED